MIFRSLEGLLPPGDCELTLAELRPSLLVMGLDQDSPCYEALYEGWEFYRAMQQIDQTPVRFLLYPGEPHGRSSPLLAVKSRLLWC